MTKLSFRGVTFVDYFQHRASTFILTLTSEIPATVLIRIVELNFYENILKKIQ